MITRFDFDSFSGSKAWYLAIEFKNCMLRSSCKYICTTMFFIHFNQKYDRARSPLNGRSFDLSSWRHFPTLKRLQCRSIHNEMPPKCYGFVYIFEICVLLIAHHDSDNDTDIIDLSAVIILMGVEFLDLLGERTIPLGIHTGRFSFPNYIDRQQGL